MKERHQRQCKDRVDIETITRQKCHAKMSRYESEFLLNKQYGINS